LIDVLEISCQKARRQRRESSRLKESETNFQQCVFQVNRQNGGLALNEVAPSVTIEEVESKTDATFTVADDVKTME
jgi:acyl CoA:acetate/3-ketoacid CoA transferase